MDEASNSKAKKPVIYSVTWSPTDPRRYRLVVKTAEGEKVEDFDNWGRLCFEP